MKPELKKLYQEVIMAHNKKPFHFEKKEEASVILEANNPLCGDRYTLYLDVEEDRIVDAHFHGFGCAISKASTSILTEKLPGKTLEEAKTLCLSFLKFIDGENREEIQEKVFSAFVAVDDFPERRGCVVLAWEVIEKHLH